MTDDDIARARQAIADEAAGPTFISTRHGERYLAALDEVEQLSARCREIAEAAGIAKHTARIRDLEIALHEALNGWVADVPGDDDDRDRLRKIAEHA